MWRGTSSSDLGINILSLQLAQHRQLQSVRTSTSPAYCLLTVRVLDLTFWSGIGTVNGFVPASGRGFVSGKAVDVPSAYSSDTTIGWSNSVAQYWAKIGSDFNFYSPAMKPGTYTMTCK